MGSSIPASVPTDAAVLPAPTAWPRVHGRRVPWVTLAGVAFVLFLALVATAAPWLAPQDPLRQSLRGRLAPPTLQGTDGRAHLLGTDHLVFFFQAEDGIRALYVTGVQTCALPI